MDDIKSFIDVEITSAGAKKGADEVVDGLNKVNKKQKETQKETDKTGKSFQTFGSKVAKVTKESTSKITGMAGGVRGLSTALTAIPKGPVAIIAAVGAAAVSGITVFKEFEKSISDLSAITGATGKDLKFLSDSARELGAVTTLSASQVSQAFTLVASAKPDLLSNAEALKAVTKETITLAEAAGVDLPTAAKTLGNALNQFGEDADQANRYINVLAAGSKFGSSTIAETAEALKNSGVAASSAGIAFESANAAIQVLAKAGVAGAEAGTSLRNIFLKLDTDMDENLRPSVVGLTTALENLNAKNLTSSELVKKFGLENKNQAEFLANNVDALRQLEEQLTGTNIAQEQAETRTANLDGAYKRFGSAVEELLLVLGGDSGLSAVWKGIVETGTFLVNTFSFIAGGLIDLVKFFGEVTGVTDLFGKAFQWLGEVSTDLANNFQGGVVTAVGFASKALITMAQVAITPLAVAFNGLKKAFDLVMNGFLEARALYLEYVKNNKEAADKIRSLKTEVQTVTSRMADYHKKFKDARKEVDNFVNSTKEQIKYSQQSKDAIKESGDAVEETNEKLETYSEAATTVIDALNEQLDALKRTDEEQAIYVALTKAGVDANSEAGEEIKKLVIELRKQEKAMDDAEDSAKKLKEEAKRAAKIQREEYEKAFDFTTDLMFDFFDKGKSGFKDWADGVVDIVKDMLKRMAAEFAASKILSFLGVGGSGVSSGGLGSVLSSFFGGSGSSGAGGGAMGALGTAKNLYSAVNTGLGIGAFYNAASTAFSQGSGFWGAIDTGLGGLYNGGAAAGETVAPLSYQLQNQYGEQISAIADFAKKAGPWMAAIAGGLYGYEQRGWSSAASGAAGGYAGYQMGATYSSTFGPVGTVVGAALGALLGGAVGGRLFGTGWQTKSSGLALGVDSGELDAKTYENRKKDKSFFRGTKRRVNINDLDSETADSLELGLEATKDTIQDYFSTLGMTVGDSVLDAFSLAPTQIKTSGKSEEEIGKAIDEWFGTVADGLTRAAQGAGKTAKELAMDLIKDSTEWDQAKKDSILYRPDKLTEYTRRAGLVDETPNFEGIETFERLQELVLSLTSVNGVLEVINGTLLESSIAGAEASESLVGVFGGLENFSSNISNFYNKFFDDTEKLQQQTSDLQSEFNSLGMELPSTRDGFRELVQGLDLMSVSGQETFAILTAMTDTMDSYYVALENQNALTEEQERKVKNLSDALMLVGVSADTANLALANVAGALEFAEGFGGADGLTTGLVAYYNAFRTEDEKFKDLAIDLSDTFSGLGISLPKTRDGFRDLFENLDLTTQSGQNLMATLVGLVPALDQYYTKLEDGYDVVAAGIGAVTDIELDRINKLKAALERLPNLEEATDSAFANLESVIGNKQSSLQTQYDKDIGAIDSKISDLKSEFSSDMSALQASTDSAAKALAQAGSRVDRETSFLRAFSDKVTGAIQTKDDDLDGRRLSRAAAQAQIEAAKATVRNGGARSLDLTESLKTLSASSEDLFSSYTEFALDRGRTNASLRELGEEASDRISIEEQSLAAISRQTAQIQMSNAAAMEQRQLLFDEELLALEEEREAIVEKFEDEMEILNTQLENARDQLNELRGINASVMSVESALGAFSSAISAELSTKAEIASLRSLIESSAANDTTVENEEVEVQGFASGGYHKGGMRVVGGNGPEIEFTGPSRIANSSQTRTMLNNDNVVMEIRGLREDLKNANYNIAKNTLDIAKIAKRWNGNGLPPERTDP